MNSEITISRHPYGYYIIRGFHQGSEFETMKDTLQEALDYSSGFLKAVEKHIPAKKHKFVTSK